MPDRLHPRLQEILRDEGWTSLTAPQEAALGPLLAGKNTLLVAPTGYGKTEAAMLPVLSRLVAERERLHGEKRAWPKGFKAIYVTPLRALNRDLLRRLSSWADTLNLEIGVRHGDTTQSERSRQSRRPPDILITTPETTQLLLYGDTLRSHLASVRFVVMDEVHDLVASERGSQLAVALERIEEVCAQDEKLRFCKAPERDCPSSASGAAGSFQRIGLSATVAETAPVARFVAGRDRDVETVVVSESRDMELEACLPEPVSDERTAALSAPPSAVGELLAVRGLVQQNERVIVFQNTRDGAELMVSRSAMLDEGARLLELHHGSLSPEHRMDVEDRFKAGKIHGLVATSSLELGIDVGAIDHVVQVHSPRSVTRMVQRLGRAGHRVGATSRGTLVAGGPEDLLECVAVARMALSGRLEPLGIRDAPLVVLANQLVALSNEYNELHPDWCYEVVTRASPFLELDRGLFDATWNGLLDFQTLFAGDKMHRIGRSGRARRHFLNHVSLIQDERKYRVIDESGKRSIGTVDDSFVAAAMHPGALIIMAGRSWRVLEVETEAQRVRVAPVKEVGSVPQWGGSDLPVSLEVAQEVARLRRNILEGDLEDLPAEPATLERAAKPIHDHVEAGLEVPTDQVVSLEVAKRLIVVNVALGNRGNDTLGRLMQALLHQRLGAAVGLQTDAYRIHLEMPGPAKADDVLTLWNELDPDHLDVLLSIVLRGTPLVRHHLVHVAKHFGALPKDLDPNRMSRYKLDALLDHEAVSEETLSRLIMDRMDVGAVQWFLQSVKDGTIHVVKQGLGPLSRLSQREAQAQVTPRTDEALLTAVRERIEASDLLMVCTSCTHNWDTVVHELPRHIRCRRCQSTQVAALRPWHKEQIPWLKTDPENLGPQEKAERQRIIKNGAIVASFGNVAARAMTARGVGPDTAARILQKVMDPEEPAFWREILQAELTFARTNAFWKR